LIREKEKFKYTKGRKNYCVIRPVKTPDTMGENSQSVDLKNREKGEKDWEKSRRRSFFSTLLVKGTWG